MSWREMSKGQQILQVSTWTPPEKGLRIRQGFGMFHWNTHIIHGSDRGSRLLSVSVQSLLHVLAHFSSSYPVR